MPNTKHTKHTKNDDDVVNTPNAPYVTCHVTQEMIDLSLRKNSGHCMTADAIQLAFPGATNISVDIQTIRFSDNQRRLRYIYLTPRKVQQYIIDWDDGIKIPPFSFVLRGGHVTEMGTHVYNRIDLSSYGVRGAESAKHERTKNRKKLPVDAKLKQNRGLGGNIPTVVGGDEPPVSRYSLRREFGLRAFQRRHPLPEPSND